MGNRQESQLMALCTLVSGCLARLETSGAFTRQEIIDLFDDSMLAVEEHFPVDQKDQALAFLQQLETPFRV